jgi:predicted RNA-binding protein YlqC (UPF0109 family)
MKDTLLYIQSHLVDHPEDVAVEETVSEEDRKTILTIRVNQEDIGKVIGKQGRIIHAIRDIIKLIAAKHDEYVDVVIEEDEPPQAAA